MTCGVYPVHCDLKMIMATANVMLYFSGDEASLADCTHSTLFDGSSCEHEDDVGLVCLTEGKYRELILVIQLMYSY